MIDDIQPDPNRINRAARSTHGISTEVVIDGVKREVQAYLLDNGHAALRVITHWPDLEQPLVSTITFANQALLCEVADTINTLTQNLDMFRSNRHNQGGTE